MSFSNSTLQLDKQQDFSLSIKIDNIIWLIVADGHTSYPIQSYKHRTIFEFIQRLNWESFLKLNSEDPLKSLHQKIDKEIQDTKNNGSTISIVKIENNNVKIWWKGDSTTHIYENDKLIYKTKNHNIFEESEKLRLEKENIKYTHNKTGKKFKLLGNNCIEMVEWPQYITFENNDKLNMTNCLGHNNITGDFIDYYEFNFTQNNKYKILCASDGFWDVFYENEDTSVILNYLHAEEITKFAESKWKQEWQQLWKNNKYTQKITTWDDISVAIFNI